MKLATLKSKSRDGELIVVSKDNQWAVSAEKIAPNLRTALENWSSCEKALQQIYASLNANKEAQAFRVDFKKFHSPLPRSFQWADGSAFIHHIKLVRKARNAPVPETLETVPLMYQGGSDDFLSPTENIPQVDFKHGTDFEAEVAVVVNDVPMGVSADEALSHVALVMIVNDVSLRGLVPEELKAGFGFFQSKPSSAFGPIAVTPDELGAAWKGGRIHLPLDVKLNGQFFGKANAGQMHFHFGELIAHAAKTRNLKAGAIIGSGTVSNEDPSVGSSCLVEKQMIELIKDGKISTSYMKDGDEVSIEMRGLDGKSLFGEIRQQVKSV